VGAKTVWNQRAQEGPHFLAGVVRAAARWLSPPQAGEGVRCVVRLTLEVNQYAPKAFKMVLAIRIGCCRPPLPLAGEGWGGGAFRRFCDV
jgi:hypothetical protein